MFSSKNSWKSFLKQALARVKIHNYRKQFLGYFSRSKNETESEEEFFTSQIELSSSVNTKRYQSPVNEDQGVSVCFILQR